MAALHPLPDTRLLLYRVTSNETEKLARLAKFGMTSDIWDHVESETILTIQVEDASRAPRPSYQQAYFQLELEIFLAEVNICSVGRPFW